MLSFHPVTMSDKNWINGYYHAYNCMSAQYTFAAALIWQEGYGIEVCEDEGYFFLRYRFTDEEGDKVSYRLPMAKNTDDEALRQAVTKLCRAHYALTGQTTLTLHGLPEEEVVRLQRLYGEKLELLESRSDFEYIYDRETIASLPGSKFHGKRGHIRKFMKADWSYQPLTENLIEDALAVNSAWIGQNKELLENDHHFSLEVKAAEFAIRHFAELSLDGGILYREGKPVAYTLGEPTGQGAFAVHFEKALYDIPGAYPTITTQFAADPALAEYRYLNREEDTGDEGLRKAKESWKPERLLPHYNAKLSFSVA